MQIMRFIATVVALLLVVPSVTTGQTNVHDLEIDLLADPTTVGSGNQVTITMTCRNNGPMATGNGNVTSSTPVGTTFVSAMTTKGQVTQQPNPGGTGNIAVALGPLSDDQVETVTVVLSVTATPGATVTVAGEIQPQFPSGDGIQSNNTSEVQVSVVAPTTADIAAEIEPDAETAGSGSLFGYTITVSNLAASPAHDRRDAATSVELGGRVPDGALFSSIELSQGSATTPAAGEPGSFICELGTLEEGATATIELTVEVRASAGSQLHLMVLTSSDASDTNPDNNTASVLTDVISSGNATVSWEAPEPPTVANPLPPPRRLVVTSSAGPGNVAWAERGSGVTGYNIYRSNKPGVTVSEGNLFASVPPTQTSSGVPVAPGGSFFTVTATYDNGESAASNEGSAQVPAATLTRVKVKAAKITAIGTGFSDTVQVFVDGIPFVAAAAVKKSNTKVVQKGNLLTGQSLGQYLQANPSVLITFRNENGGVTAYRHPQ